MNRLYLTYNERSSKREYYSYAVLKNNPVYVSLNANEIEGYLYKILSSEIAKIKEISASLMEITMETGEMIIIDNVKVFKSLDKFDQYIREFQKRIKAYREAENIRDYKERLPKRYIPKVNRVKSRARNKLLISGVSLALVAILASNYLNEEIKKLKTDDFNDYRFAFVEDTTKTKYKKSDVIPDTVLTSENTASLGVPSIDVEFDFEDWTNEGKLEQTIELCSPYMETWIERYDLPRDLTYALASLEKGLLDCSPQDNGACGPMQIQVGPQHCDHYKVPIYQNGVFTGEYDEFWAADINKLDDPRLSGKPIKIIQNLEDNFQIGCAYFRRCINKYKNIFLAVDAYNKGINALSRTYEVCGSSIDKPLEYYKENFNDFSWINIIPSHSKEVFGIENYGDPIYVQDVLKYLKTDDRGTALIEYSYGEEKIVVDLSNTNVYNNEITKG